METAPNQYDEYISLKTHLAELSDQLARIKEKEKKSTSESRSLEFDVEQARRKFHADEKRHIRDEINDKELATSKAQIDSLNQKLKDARRIQELASAALPDINSEIVATNQKINVARRNYCQTIKSNIVESIDKNQEIRTKLIEAFSAILSSENLHEPKCVRRQLTCPL